MQATDAFGPEGEIDDPLLLDESFAKASKGTGQEDEEAMAEGVGKEEGCAVKDLSPGGDVGEVRLGKTS